jgi:predicted nuclease with TOPRIM domain
VETGLRTEIAEDFMNKLKDLFVESYIEVPETQVNLVDELAEQVEELEQKLNEQTAAVLETSEKLEEYQRETVIRESARDLADTQVEKLRSLVSSLDFENEEVFEQKVKTVKESYFKKDVSSQDTEVADEIDTDSIVETTTAMEMYLNAIKKHNK